MNLLTQRVNSYFAILLIAVAGIFAAALIIHVADTTVYSQFQPTTGM
ncbi:MAG: hypothetical protein WAN50_03540 [Minisyncoccia bacterium]